MYSNSVTTGNWEGYIAEDLVAYMDRTYRTLPRRDSRGLAGHSMGGYGTIRIGMKRPDVFASIYALSSCCLNEGTVRPPRGGGPSPAGIDSHAGGGARQPWRAGHAGQGRGMGAESGNPPLFLDLPTKNGEVQPAVAVKWAANSPVAMLDQYVPNLKTLKGIALDIGLQDSLITSNQVLVEALKRFGVRTRSRPTRATTGTGFPQRLEEKVLPFSRITLSFEQRRESSRR